MLNITNKILTILNQTELFSEIDLKFADFINRLSGSRDGHPEIFLGAALVSRATGNGDICLDLNSVCETALFQKRTGSDAVICPPLSKWRETLLSSHAVGKPGDKRPLILDDCNRLYLFRYWEYEKKLSDSLRERAKGITQEFDLKDLNQRITGLFPQNERQEINWQKVAVSVAILKRFSVITGGPGSGKTFIIARILTLLLECSHQAKPHIYLAAPTGKAAARLADEVKQAKHQIQCHSSILESIPHDAYTLHRLLKPLPGSPYFRYNCENLLPADIVIVDEASMIDLALMSKLVQAVPASARLIMVGDKDQLASVEAGSVLGDICDRNIMHGFSIEITKQIEELTGEPIGQSVKAANRNYGLQDCIVVLQKSYRFTPSAGIGGLSRAVNRGDPDASLKQLGNPDDESITWLEIRNSKELMQKLEDQIIYGYSKYLKLKDPLQILEEFNRFRILCALKIGSYGAREINKIAEHILSRHHLIRPRNLATNPWYNGRPVIITTNDYNLGLFNGDIGITMSDSGSHDSDLHVFFPGNAGALKRFPPYRLPEHETVFAMTVHKSQGSEFDEVLLILPDKDYPLITRELIYTGITRARKKVSVWGSKSVLYSAIERKIERISGLRDALWNKMV